MLFGIAYFLSDSLEFNPVDKQRIVTFWHCMYFSSVTFMTIGFGDVIPKVGIGQILVFIESCIALIFTPLFGGYLAYQFLQRPKDILLTDNYFIRYRNNNIFLSTRLGNKGKNIIDCNASVELIHIVNNVKRTLYKMEFSNPLVELNWFLDIRLNGIENNTPLQHLKTLLNNPGESLIRVTVIGTDSDSGNMVHVYKYYKMDDLKYGGKFLDVYNWKGVFRTEPNWANFNSIAEISASEQQIINTLLL